VPWCEPCGRFYNPNTLSSDGTCPADHPVSDPHDNAKNDEQPARVPWHFWLLLVALLGYLGWRLVQGVGWLVG
jgi:hypothetical protein